MSKRKSKHSKTRDLAIEECERHLFQIGWDYNVWRRWLLLQYKD